MGKYLDSLGLSHLIGLIKTALSGKQATLVSGTNIKTINNESLLGSGNISVSGGSGNYLPLTGGELTGELTVDTDITRGDTPSSDQYPAGIIIGDSTGEQIGYIGALQQTNGNEGIHLGVSRVVNGTTYYHSLRMYISSSGGLYVGVDSQSAWRNALGLGSLATKSSVAASDITSGTLSLARGGTGVDGTNSGLNAGEFFASSPTAVNPMDVGFRRIVESDLPDLSNTYQAAGDYWEAVKDSTGYYGLRNPEGGTTGWVRTTAYGLLPAVSGGGSSSLGTSGWPFKNLYAENIYHNGTKLGTAATHNHGDYIASTDSRVGSIESTSGEIRITSLNGLLRLTLTTGNNLRVDTRASTSDEWSNGLYYPGIAPVNETTIANVITQTSTQSTNNPITAAKYYKVNCISMVEITFKPAAARSAGTAISLGTIVSGKRPHLQASGGSDRIMGSITSAGVCNLYVRTALTANTAYTIGFTYTI